MNRFRGIPVRQFVRILRVVLLLVSAFELQARAILGLPVDALMISPAAARTSHPAPTAQALTAALAVPESDLRVFDAGPGPRRGVALATAPDVASARDRVRDVANAVGISFR